MQKKDSLQSDLTRGRDLKILEIRKIDQHIDKSLILTIEFIKIVKIFKKFKRNHAFL